MKFLFNLSLVLFLLAIFENRSLALTDYKIKEICRKEKKTFSCIQNLKEKRLRLKEGNQIEIPVIPYKGWFNFYISNSDSKRLKAFLYFFKCSSESSLKPTSS